ncbi:MAG TPA: DUF1822 family protein [Crinalium sp.]|jgi:hypothetical protein
MNSITYPSINVPLSRAAHELAGQFAAEQASPQKGKQVYLNTLAVWAVHRYLTWLQIETDLQHSQSWDAKWRSLFNVADLVLPGLGHLECCPVLPGEQDIHVSAEGKGDRLGYIAVQFDESLQSVDLLGFVAVGAIADETETVALADVQPLETLLERLAALEGVAESPDSILVNLGNWLHQVFEMGWQAVEALVGDATPSFAFRRAPVRRAKRIEVEQEGYPSSSVMLILSLMPETSEQIGIHVQICPVGESAYLPSQLRLRVLTEGGDVFREIMAGEADTFVQYEFTAQVGERFSLEAVSGNTQITETFVV